MNTKADLYEKFNTYFCSFYALGCCAEDANCSFIRLFNDI